MSVSPKGDFAIRNVSAIPAATKKTADCRSIKHSKWPISDIQELLRECQHGCLKDAALAKKQAVEKTIANATARV